MDGQRAFRRICAWFEKDSTLTLVESRIGTPIRWVWVDPPNVLQLDNAPVTAEENLALVLTVFSEDMHSSLRAGKSLATLASDYGVVFYASHGEEGFDVVAFRTPAGPSPAK